MRITATGSVGRVIPGCEVKIAEDGDPACGGNVMRLDITTMKKRRKRQWPAAGSIQRPWKISEDGYLFSYTAIRI